MHEKSTLSTKQIWNLNFGYLGLQVCMTLVLSNASRILSTLGADSQYLAYLWLVAPIAGLLIQPLIGYFSDKTWGRFGRRIPYLFIGICLTAFMMILIPNSGVMPFHLSPVMVGVCVFFISLSSLNIAMQPYRALINDTMSRKQNSIGYSIQTSILNIGGIIGAFLPFALTNIGLNNTSDTVGKIPETICWAFYISSFLLILTGMWTCISVKESPPAQLSVLETKNAILEKRKNRTTIQTLLRLSVVQFFTWSAFFYMWVYMTEGIALHVWNTLDPLSKPYNDAGNWFGIMTAIYNCTAASVAIWLSYIAKSKGIRPVYSVALFIGSIAMLSIYFITNKYLLLIPMVGIGIAWAATLTFPFVILSRTVPLSRNGFYMGIVNITIVIPQIVAGLTGAYLFRNFVNQDTIGMIAIAGILLFTASISVRLLKRK